MSKTNEIMGQGKKRPYEEIGGSRLNRCLIWPARVLICALAVLVFLAMSNPAQTALLGRASLAGLGLGGDGLEELQAAETLMQGTVNALTTQAAQLEKAGDGLTAAGTEMTTAKNALKDARTAMTNAQATLDATLGAETATLDAIIADDFADVQAQLTNLTMAGESVQAAMDIQTAMDPASAEASAELLTAMESAMYLMWDVSMNCPELADTSDAAATVLSDAAWYVPGPTREEQITQILAEQQAAIGSAQQKLEAELAAKQAEAEAAGQPLSEADQAQIADKLDLLASAAEAVQRAADAQAAALADPTNEAAAAAVTEELNKALDVMKYVGGQSLDVAKTTDLVAAALKDAIDYESPLSWNEKAAQALTETQQMLAARTAQAEETLTLRQQAQADARALREQQGTAMTDVEASIAAATAALDAADAAVKAAQTAQQRAVRPNATEEIKADAAVKAAEAAETLAAADAAMDACAAALRMAEGPSIIAGTELPMGHAGRLRTCANVFMLAVVIGLVGMVLSLGNNRMRKIGLPVIAVGALAAVAMLAILNGVHASIADGVAALKDVYSISGNIGLSYGGVSMSEALSSAIGKLSLERPDALWVCLAVAAATFCFALAAWLTLPRQVEAKAQHDWLTIFMRLTRVLIAVTGMMVFFPGLNPGRVSALINENMSLFTVATSYGTLTNTMQYALTRGMIESSVFVTLMLGAGVIMIGIVLNAAGACMSLGNNRMKKKGLLLPLGGSMAIVTGLIIVFSVYNTMVEIAAEGPTVYKNIQPMLPSGMTFWAVSAVLVFISTFVTWFLLPDELEEKMEMEEKYRNFLLFLPILLLTFIFCYLPIFGWRFAFFDYDIGDQLVLYDTVVDGVVTQESNYVGLKWFTYLFQNEATLGDLVRVLRNTLIMSGLGIATSWLPIAFAVLLAELRSSKFQRVVQTLTTIPNFISWVLVYAIAFAIFSTDGFINSFLRNVMGAVGANTDYLASADWIWVKMLLWGTWKGLGWSAIVYIAGIAGIDQQLYEAARVDGANRFQCIRHITIPGLVPTYMVMLLMSVAGILSNGMDQYLVFENAINKDVIEVLDLYVYNIGIKSGLIPLSTVVGVFKSLIGVTLLFGANGISKALRGESII